MLFWVGGWLVGWWLVGWWLVGWWFVVCMCCNNMVSCRISNRRTERVIDSPPPRRRGGKRKVRRVEVCLAGWVGVTTAESVPLPRPSKSFSGTGHSPSGTKRFGSILGSPSTLPCQVSPQTPVLPSPPGKAETSHAGRRRRRRKGRWWS